MVEQARHTEDIISAEDYIRYKSAMQDFAQSCGYALNVLSGNPFRADTARPLKNQTESNIEIQLLDTELKSITTDRFFGQVSLFHASLENYDTARTWAQHVSWPLRRFDALMFLAGMEKTTGKTTRDTVQSARESLDQLPILTVGLKPHFAANWARLAPFAKDIQKNPKVYIDTAKYILASTYPDSVKVYPYHGPEGTLDNINSLYASIARSYLVLAEIEGKLGFNFVPSLLSAKDHMQIVSDEEWRIDLSLRTALVKRTIGLPFNEDIEQAKKAILDLGEKEHRKKYADYVLSEQLLWIAKTKFYSESDIQDPIEFAREIALDQKDPEDSFRLILNVALFEKMNGLDTSQSLQLAREVKTRFGNDKRDNLEEEIVSIEHMKRWDKDPDYLEDATIDQVQERLKNATTTADRWNNLRDLIQVEIVQGLSSAKSIEDAESLVPSFEIALQVHCLLELAQLAAEAGLNPTYYLDKVRNIVYQKMIKSYRTFDLLGDINKTEMKIAEHLMRRCHKTLIQLTQEEIEQLTREAIRLNDRDCLKALGTFLPLKTQDKYESDSTRDFFLSGRSKRRIW